MRWYRLASGYETLDGTLMERARRELVARIRSLRDRAVTDEFRDLDPRWRGEVRRRSLLLPSTDCVGRRSIHEIREVQKVVGGIEDDVERFREG